MQYLWKIEIKPTCYSNMKYLSGPIPILQTIAKIHLLLLVVVQISDLLGVRKAPLTAVVAH